MCGNYLNDPREESKYSEWFSTIKGFIYLKKKLDFYTIFTVKKIIKNEF